MNTHSLSMLEQEVAYNEAWLTANSANLITQTQQHYAPAADVLNARATWQLLPSAQNLAALTAAIAAYGIARALATIVIVPGEGDYPTYIDAP